MKTPEPTYRKRTWRTSKGEVKVRWMVSWRSADPDSSKLIEHRKSGFLNKAQAQTWFRRHALPALEQGHATPAAMASATEADANLKAAREMKFSQWKARFIEERKIAWSDSTRGRYESLLNLAAERFGDIPLAGISRDNIQSLIQVVLKSHHPSKDTILTRYRTIHCCLQAAVSAGAIEKNPCAGITLPRTRHGRLVFLEIEECVRLLDSCDEVAARNASLTSPLFLKAMVAIGLFTGARRAEILHLEWDDFDRKMGACRIQPKPEYGFNTKSGKDRTVGVNAELFKILDAFRADLASRLSAARKRVADLENWQARTPESAGSLDFPEDIAKYERPPTVKLLLEKARGLVVSLELQLSSKLVLPSPVTGGPMTDLPRGYKEAVKRAGLTDRSVCFHTLRHTYASMLVKAGVDLPTLQLLMGHSDIKTTMRYAHLGQSHVTKAGTMIPIKLNEARTHCGHDDPVSAIDLSEIA